MNWQWTGSANKSIEEMEKLVGIMQDDRFSKEDVMSFNIRRETAKFDEHLASSESGGVRDGWKEGSVDIQVPDRKCRASEADVPVFSVPGLFYRPLVEVIKSAVRDVGDRCFHYTPFKQFWWPSPDSPPQRVHDELYSSNAMVEAHTALQNSPQEPNCTLERVVLALMFWSDSTHLASFGDASLWPLYMFFGNQSKWLRAKPRCHVCHHVAYFPKLPDSFSDFFKSLTGHGPPAEVLTHCRRELMHAIWHLLLDDEFLEAYEHGIVIECEDGIFRRFYQRIFTYSADYPEKVLLAAIRGLGNAPCPRCYMLKSKFPGMGTEIDMKKREELKRTDDHIKSGVLANIRRKIYQLGFSVKSKSQAFTYFLDPKSWTPTSNAFSDRLSQFGFNPFKMLVPDFMHEFELGVFKSFFIHLLRIMYAQKENAIENLNERFRLIPIFGQSTIRRFTQNTSALKKMAAWNYQNILLQCSIPVVEGLLPEPYNTAVLDALFALGEWHALAKLKLHTDTTLGFLRTATKAIGTKLRRFQKVVCPNFDTKELPAEGAARQHRQNKKTATGKGQKGKGCQDPMPVTKEYNLETYKFHSLGDYHPSIIQFGTSDSYTTQTGELEHRRVKHFYARTNKNRAVRQMSQLERRETALIQIAHRARAKAAKLTTTPTPDHQGRQKKLKGRRKSKSQTYLSFAQSEALPYTTPDQHHHISPCRDYPVNIQAWLAENKDDPAIENFLPKLQEHLLSRLEHPEWSGDGNEFTAAQRYKLRFENSRFYRHKILRINYTTYDVRRGQDCLNPRTHSDVMHLSPDEEDSSESHPFAYAQIIGIFHANVVNTAIGANPKAQPMEFLWVRCYRLDPTWRGGFKKKRLFRLEFLPETDPNAFGFLNPDEVIRGAHVVPAFAYGRTEHLLEANSIGRLPREGLSDSEDWRYYYVNFFVDRDMYVQYIGGGVGHYKLDIPQEEQRAPANEEEKELEEEDIMLDFVDVPVEPEPPLPIPDTNTDIDSDSDESGSEEGPSASQNLECSGSDRTGSDSDSGPEEQEDGEPDLGPEDGDGFVADEMEEGYMPL
ncbi:hypothetical protein GGX14DRAFT_352730 [Mycena pura]|uniref:Uncharacterized protein n=1 Tax=Mycena pura TaxID=153505 RepID=A0AAD6YLJ8_9AGAR|nr:hypothetical protein GGX14DRAFT_352730 [Mycena pura]